LTLPLNQVSSFTLSVKPHTTAMIYKPGTDLRFSSECVNYQQYTKH